LGKEKLFRDSLEAIYMIILKAIDQDVSKKEDPMVNLPF
jgi:hypothetical protein